MDRFQHEEGWKPRSGQPFYFQYWDRCGCGRIQHYEAAKVEIAPPKPNLPPAPPPDSPLAAARSEAKRAIDARIGRNCKGAKRRKFIADLLCIEERYAYLGRMDEVECFSIVERLEA